MSSNNQNPTWKSICCQFHALQVTEEHTKKWGGVKVEIINANNYNFFITLQIKNQNPLQLANWKWNRNYKLKMIRNWIETEDWKLKYILKLTWKFSVPFQFLFKLNSHLKFVLKYFHFHCID